MRVAFASKDRMHIDQHFGWCERFYVYEITHDDSNFSHEIDTSLAIDDEASKLEYRINALEGIDIVYLAAIGPKASTMVKSAGIFPLKSSSEGEKIAIAIHNLQNLIANTPPLWLQRILVR